MGIQIQPGTIRQFEERYQVRLRPKEALWWARLIARFFPAFNIQWWTTVRFPFGKPTIAYPRKVVNPMNHRVILEHEMIHVSQIRTAWGLFKTVCLYFFFPLPVLFSGRWFIERPAYLVDIKERRLTIDQAIDILWNGYLWVWPKTWMRRWFLTHLARMVAQGAKKA